MTKKMLKERTLVLPIYGTKTHCSSGCCWFSYGSDYTHKAPHGDGCQCLLFGTPLQKDIGSQPARRCDECTKFEQEPEIC